VPADILDELGVNNGTEEPKREPAFSNKGFAMPDAGPVSQVMGVIENHGSLFESIQAAYRTRGVDIQTRRALL